MQPTNIIENRVEIQFYKELVSAYLRTNNWYWWKAFAKSLLQNYNQNVAVQKGAESKNAYHNATFKAIITSLRSL